MVNFWTRGYGKKKRSFGKQMFVEAQGTRRTGGHNVRFLLTSQMRAEF